MANVIIDDSNLVNIAKAIRTKNGTESTYTPSEMAAAIEEIEPTLIEKHITANGTYNVADENADGYSVITVNVPNTGGGGGSDSSVWDLQTEKNFISNRSAITNLTLPDGITKIEDNVFNGCVNLRLTSLPDSITDIGHYAFSACQNLALTELPDGITEIKSNTFTGCQNLALTRLPTNTTMIYECAFQNTGIAITTIPASVIWIGDAAFDNCLNLTTITFECDPSVEIMETAFSGCENLTTINVPWNEGEGVADWAAPWGAYNATINYGYVG